jgi:ribosomal protein S18 acetylase RimI-like enzyme
VEHEVVVSPWRGGGGLVRLLAAYHLATEAEKGSPVASAADLPERYRREVADPARAFAADTVLVARAGDVEAGCVVLTAPVAGSCEIKRLWVDPAARGRGIAGALVRAALARADDGGASVRLSVWSWRAGAVALYERLGFRVVAPWDERPGLVCMEHPG